MHTRRICEPIIVTASWVATASHSTVESSALRVLFDSAPHSHRDRVFPEHYLKALLSRLDRNNDLIFKTAKTPSGSERRPPPSP